MSKHIDLAKKLKALAERGIDGEKENAEAMLTALMKKHNITIEDIEGEKQEYYFLNLNPRQSELFNQIIGTVKKSLKFLGEFPKNKIKKLKLKGNYAIQCSASEFIEIEAKYNFYNRLYESEENIFYLAFLKANQLLIAADEDSPTPSKKELDKWKRINEMSSNVKAEQFRKQLENKA